MLKILIPVDGSESSLNAVRHVVRLKESNTALSVILLNVYQESVPYGAVDAQVTVDRIREIEKEYTDPALAEAERILREAGIEYERDFRVAVDVAPIIARRAEELRCDAIVMGTHGGGVLARALIGSTAMKVVHLVHLPVTVIK
jgi:nucleotide-binding universal stress UspA family protein